MTRPLSTAAVARRLMALALPALAAVACLVVPDVAAAAGADDVREAGQRIGDTLRTWAGSLFGGGAAITACWFLFTRKVGPALAFTALAMLVGGFVFAPQEMGDLSEGMWKLVLD